MIRYELTNPMKLSEADHRRNMKMLFTRCVACCRYCPDLWMRFISYEASVDWSSASQLIGEVKDAMPSCAVLRLALCDLYEQRGLLKEAEAEYERMIGACETSVGWIVYQQFMRRNHGIAAARGVFQRARLSLLAPEIFIAAGAGV